MINHISHLIINENEVVDSHDEMCKVAVEYFRSVFEGDSNGYGQNEEGDGRIITDDQNAKLTADITFAEFTLAVKQMHPDKSVGPDGFSPAFFQHFWGLLGEDVVKCCRDWLREGSFPASLNDTTLVLIPKKENADRMTELRPIALCNVLYKILAKVLANRLKVILPAVITENQSAFVPGRNISDNVLVAFETLHVMKKKNRGQEGEVALKLDISKAYDRVDWLYLKRRMQDMGFNNTWIKWIMLYVSTVSYKIAFNGSTVGPIVPSRGLRQGDPMSPYLFLFCVDGLSQSLSKAANEGVISGCKISSNAPQVTHLLFADDNFLFFKATGDEAGAIKALLNEYGNKSGQVINYQKSGIFFSANVRRDKQQEIKGILGVHNELGNSKYLGLPSLIGRSKKSVFGFVKDRVWRKVQDWSHKLLSKAGKTIMVKNVAQTIPSYSMSCFLIPKSLCSEIERLMNGYWWSSSGNSNRGIRWLAWDKMAIAKSRGGLGFRDLHGFNLALLGKHIWNFSQKPNSLVARIFKTRYFPDRYILEASKGNASSFIWSGIWKAKEKLKRGFRWVLGDGKDIKIFKDPWLQGKVDFRVEDNHLNIVRDEKVCFYFRPNSKVWDVQKVKHEFHVDDSNLILQTRIPQNEVQDRLAWTGSNKGIYTVKSGYHYWAAQNNNNDNMTDSKGWNKLWNLQLPHKLKMFLLRFCKNNIPVRYLLRSKGVATTIMCPMCETDIEHLRHLFCECPFAKECWRRSGLTVDMQNIELASSWLLEMISKENADIIQKLAIVLSGIWFSRNKKVWEGRNITPAVTVDLSSKQVKEWQEAANK